MPFNGKATTNSLMVARAFGKDHSKVLRDIRKLECSKEFTEANFGLRFYFNKLRNGVVVKCPVYIMTRDGFTFLAMGFTGKVAAKFKEKFVNTQRIAIFAILYNFAGGLAAKDRGRHFLCPRVHIVRLCTPVWSVNAPTACERCRVTGKAKPFFFV